MFGAAAKYRGLFVGANCARLRKPGCVSAGFSSAVLRCASSQLRTRWRWASELSEGERGDAVVATTCVEGTHPYLSLRDQSADWSWQSALPLRGTDSHTSDIGHWFGMTKSKCGPRRGLQAFSKNALALCGKTAPQSSRSLPRKHSFLRPGVGLGVRVFRRKMRATLALFFGVGYTVGGIIEKRPFPACGNRRFGSGRFLYPRASSIANANHKHHLFHRLLFHAAGSVWPPSSAAIRLSRRSSSSILPSLSNRSTARVRCSRSPTIRSSVR